MSVDPVIMYPKNFKKPSTITLTVCECGENHVGMEKIGEIAPEGYSYEELFKITKILKKSSIEYEFVCLNDLLSKGTSRIENVPHAFVLIIRDGVNFFLKKSLGPDVMTADDLLEEVSDHSVDTTFYDKRRKKVLKKLARYNNMFVEGMSQPPDIENKKGTVHDVYSTAVLDELLKSIKRILQDDDLCVIEGNYYYDTKKTYIGQHG